MRSRQIKMAVVVLLVFLLAWQDVFASLAHLGATSQSAKRSCCCSDCDNKHCATPACCVRPNAPSAPVAPASLPSTSQNEFHALAASVVSLLVLPSRAVDTRPSRPFASSSVTSIPLFQRDCSYLL